MLFSCCLVHPSIMGRRAAFPLYSMRFLHAEDYGNWLALLAGSTSEDLTGRPARLANLPQPLLRLRKHAKSISHQYSALQRFHSLAAVQEYLGLLLGLPTH